MFVRRFASFVSMLAIVSASMAPRPAGAVSTEKEILQGRQIDKQVLSQFNVVSDPLLNEWVNGIANKLWGQVARKDVPYNIKILDSQVVNSFTVGGGYIYVDEGLLDFVQSDDELAGVIGHETGHNERRHTVTLPAKAQALDLLFGIASIFSPFIYNFGSLAEAGLIMKQSRADELQADQYGLMLMSRAGYDPDSMVSFMKHMGAAHDEHDSLVDKYLEDHPGFPDRVSHLEGYDELDPTKRTTDQILVQALHDEQSARYNIAAMKYAQVLKADPGNSLALLHLGQTQIALGQTSKSEQTLAEAAAKGTVETRTAAVFNMKALRASEAKFTLTRPNLAPLRQQLADAQTRDTEADATISARRDAGRDQVKAIQSRIEDVSYEVPDFSRVPIRHGGRLEAVLRNLEGMSREIDASFEKSRLAIAQVGTMEKNRESGLVRENADILKELGEPLALDPVPAESLSTLPNYPRMFGDLQLTDSDMVRSLDAARSSLAILDVSLGDLDEFIKRLGRAGFDFSGDISQSDYNSLLPLMQKANDGLSKASIAGSQAEQLFNLARARQLQTRITMLGVGYPEDRFATLNAALNEKVHNAGLTYDAMIHEGLSPGEVVSAAIVAGDTNTTPQAIVDEAKSSNKTIVDVANERGMHGMTLEIFLGLIYLDYTDDPSKEAHGHTT